MAGNELKVQYYRSAIGRQERQKRTVRAMGFTKLNQIRTLPANEAVRGMIFKISHLVRIVD